MRSILLLSAAALLAACSDTATVDAEPGATEPATVETTDTQAPRTQTTRTLADTAQDMASERGAARAGVTPLSQIADPKLEKESITADIDVLKNEGGNVAILYGPEGALLVDDKFARNAEEILAHVSSRGGALPVFVLNTHYHGDHSGSNAQMKAVGALVIAQDGARDLMSRSIDNQLFGRTTDARPVEDHPQLTFGESLTLDFGDETLSMVHTPSAHTGGDLIVQFEEANVLHMGDLMFNGMFPYVDIDSGGSLQGVIAAQNLALRLSDDDTTVIPGHGPITDREGLQATHDMLIEIRDRMQARIDAGDDLDAVLAADIYADFDMNDGFINNENIAKIAYRSLTMNRP